MFNAVILNQNEEIITFLDHDLIDIVESNEIGQLRTINVKYPVDTEEDVSNIFKLGNKIWVQGDSNFTDCLYVMDSPIKRDYFDEKLVSFEAEDVLVELNYAPFFTQTDLKTSNGFTITKDSSQNNEDNVLINYKALKYWFGDYYDIGIVQKCLTDYVQKVSLYGTMSLMELLRYIETETGNVFRTRYEKDVNSNLIHRYLDFLNPENANKSWELNLECELLTENEDDDDLFDDDDDLSIYQNKSKVFNPADLTVQLLDENEDVIVFNKGLNSEKSLEWSVSELGYTDEDIAHITLTYEDNSSITIKCDCKNFTLPAEINQLGTVVDNDFTSIAGDQETHVGILPDVTIFQVVNSEDEIVYRQTIQPVLGDVHEEVLDLVQNVENIEYDVNETDTYTAITPVLSLNSSGGDSNSLTKANMDTIIERWINLSVTKGHTIPMIIQKITVTGDDNNPIKNLSAAKNKLKTMNVSDNYWIRPVKPNDSTEGDSNSNKSYEFLVATAYWTAPFTKNAGEIFITDETITGVDYNQIKGKNSKLETRSVKSTPKMGRVETSDEDPYAIYNDVAMKLKDKRYPEINLDVEVANLKNHNYNDYNIYDKVYIKIPLFDHLITARVIKTTKNSKNIAENKIELGSYSINVRTPLTPVLIEGSNISFKYPKSKKFTVKLEDYDGNPLKNKLISFSLANVENGSNTITGKTKNVKTNSQGEASITCKYDPGDYEITCQFGGDESYEPTSSTFEVNVSGTKPESKSTKTSTKKSTKTKTTTKTVKRYYDKYGRSPDKKKVLSIGRISAGADKGSYADFFETEFENYCPKCKKRGTLMWGIFWAGNEHTDYGRFPGTGNNEGSSAEGAVFCSNQRCDGDWSAQGNEHGYENTKLRVSKSRKKSSKARAYKLKQGKILFDTIKKTVSAKNNTGNTAQPINSAVSKKIINKAKSIVGSHTGLQAAKDCLNFVTYKIKWEDRNNFYQTPERTLSRKTGNCCCQTQLLFELMDAAGVTETYKLQYIHTVGGKGGHVFGRLVNKKTGKGVYIDPCHTSKPYGGYCQGYGKIGSASPSWYPNKPF